MATHGSEPAEDDAHDQHAPSRWRRFILPQHWSWPSALRGGFEHAYLLDTRHAASRLLKPIKQSIPAAALKLVLCIAGALLIAFVPEYHGLNPAAQRAFFILLLASSLWLTEAIPSFAVGLMVIALNVALLGSPKGSFADGDQEAWVEFVAPWGSPLLWLFFGGFVLSAAATKAGLDRRFALGVLSRFGTKPSAILAGVMIITFVCSMFMSNTATAAMMLAMLSPVLAKYQDDGFSKSLILGTAMAANIGGMGTIIGTPPNAIAAGALVATKPIGFAEWIFVGLPPASLLAILGWSYLVKAHPTNHQRIDLRETLSIDASHNADDDLEPWQIKLTSVILIGTVLMWLTSSLHGIPTAVVAVMPIAFLTVAGVLDERDIRGLSWDVLLLLAGGLSLGIAVAKTGMADWLITQLPISGMALLPLALVLAYLTSLLSNVMSNTATANILIPLAMALSPNHAAAVAIPLALAASSAMCMPISTPPNAIAFGTGRITTKELLRAGAVVGVLAPLFVVLWSRFSLLILGHIKP